jgi:PAS domain S-box-containing protein
MGALLETRNIERMQAEEGLKSSEGRLKILFECAPDPYYITDIDGRIVDENKAVIQITGYSREELTGKNLFELDLLLPEDAPRAAGLLAQNALGHPTGPEEFILKRKDGTQVFLEARAFPTVIAGQTVVLGIARDITKRKQALEALQESRHLLANIINFLPDATFVIDKKGRVIAWNQAMEEMSGVSAADMLGKGDYEYAMCFYGERRPTLIDLVLDPGGEVEANYLSLTRKGIFTERRAFCLTQREMWLALSSRYKILPSAGS